MKAKEKSTMLSDLTVTYLYQAISDIQGTIRAIDTKLSILLVILSLPFTNLGKIYNRISVLLKSNPQISIEIVFVAMTVIFSVTWLIAFVSALRGIISVDNPSKHISGIEQTKNGSFYSSGLFNLALIDCFFNRKKVMSRSSFSELLSNLPVKTEQIANELRFEQLKLAYIRDIKLNRQLWAFRFSFFWLFFGFAIYSISVLLKQ